MNNTIDNLPNKEEVTKVVERVLQIAKRDDEPLDLTVATNNEDPDKWSFQTGDNSYSGGCYAYYHWAVVTVDPDDEPEEIIESIYNQFNDICFQ